MRSSQLLALVVSSLIAGCSSSETGDAIDDDFVGDGKADGAIAEGSPDALGVLAVVNTLDQDGLDDDVGLDARAAGGIAKHRAAADGALDTADDDRFDTLVELDKVPYVGKTAFAKLLAFARANGYVAAGSTGKQVSTCRAASWPGEAVCGDAAWSYEWPKPTGFTLRASRSFGPSDVWAAGDQGTVLHFDGTAWTPEATPICEGIYDMWGTSATNLWAVGVDGRVIHRTAAGWQAVDVGTCVGFSAVWGTSDTDVWIASEWDAGHLFHGGTQGFTEVAQIGAARLFGFASDDVWAVGSGTVWHYDGAAWTTVYQQHTVFTDVWGSDPDHMFMAGFDYDQNNNAVWTFSAATASAPVQKTLTRNMSPSLHGTAANNVWLTSGSLLYHYDGAAWTYVAEPDRAVDLRTITVASPTAVWAFGAGGEILRYDGTTWSSGNQAHAVFGLWGLSKNDVWAASSSGLRHYDGTSWTQAPGISGFFYDVWGTSPTNIYAVGFSNKFFHYDGTTWSPVTVPTNSTWYSIEGTSSSDIWVSGYEGAAMHFDGTTWTAVPKLSGPYTKVHTIHPVGANDVWAATSQGLVHWDGSGWAVAGPLNAGEMQGVWGTANDLWATGRGVWHYDGNTWTKLVTAQDVGVDFPAVWGTGTDDVWVAMGSEIGYAASSLLHWDGHSWTTHVSAAGERVGGGLSLDGETWVTELAGGIVRLAH